MSYRPTYQKGEWLAVCDICGRQFKASQLQKRWDGFMVDSDCWEPRQPQDFVRGVADFQSPPYTRPETPDVFLPVTYQLYAQEGSYNISGNNIGLMKSVSTKLLTAISGAYTYIGQIATLGWTKRNLIITAGTYSYTGDGIAYYRGRYMPVVQDSYVYTSNAVIFSLGKGLAIANGSYTYTGQTATLTWHQLNIVLTTIQGSYVYTGETAILSHGKSVSITAGSYTYTGEPATLSSTVKTYATWDPANKGPSIVLSNGNLTASGSLNDNSVIATIGKSSGKWYWEVAIGSYTTVERVGFATSAVDLTQPLGSTAASWGLNGNSGAVINNNTTLFSGLGTFTTGDIMGFALDMGAGSCAFYKNNTLLVTVISLSAGTYYPALSLFGTGDSSTANFGATALVYTPPAGFNSGVYN